MTEEEVAIYALGWNAAMACAAATLRSPIIRKNATFAELADHMDMMLITEVADVPARDTSGAK